MTYKLELVIDHEKQEFSRNNPPMLKDMTQALILQRHQLEMYSDEGGPSDEHYKRNEKDLAEFAVKFWNGQFKTEQVVNGCTLASLDEINNAIGDSLGKKDTDSEEKPEKK
ncbi:phage tail assembly chaperone G [Loigolactobacillus coryniformis]|uniref:Uncharacterized protein n=1 Tax=Loigolactobacillus coryniformis subsp. torquens DSM 20004 = KCTC 3535 TaxID=1423822 RepID=A0A2D1KN02_9LACO|nr:hypothetical protein [Loigolactobacillus coryniformis]ATO43412.1 hypothetical protein LC20004_05605 [Loigolactobacillus coryniformis subsp. torquens DSM 20004 = KCTC 3535]KRK85516.1 hypothetical protein FC16_GL001473 [Loigolactobacillus coryniformis subsp. torquens DSM 20004 = KCTC 3535]